MKLSDYVAWWFKQRGAKHAFVLSGGASIHLIDSWARTPGLEIICPQHEQAAAFMADAYTREGGVGVAITTSGPGATNLITGICCSWFDSIPSFFITGQVSSKRLTDRAVPDAWSKNLRRQTGFQETDIVSMVSDVTKRALQLKRAEDIRYLLEDLWHHAHEGRMGPVLIDIPDDLQREEVDHDSMVSFATSPRICPEEPSYNISDILERLKSAQRPVFVFGAGVTHSGGMELAHKISQHLGVPVCPTWATYDQWPYDHPLFGGGFGISSARWGNFTIQNSDLIISVGSRLDTHATGWPLSSFARGARKIIVDIDQAELDKFDSLPNSILIRSDAKAFLGQLWQGAQGMPKLSLEPWLTRISQWKADFPLCPPELKDVTDRVDSYVFLEELHKQSAKDAIFYVDCGGNLTQFFTGYKMKPGQRVVSAWNNSPMGYALPAAVGASLAHGKREIIVITGDMGLLLNIQELATVAKYQLPLKIFVLNNEGHGIVRQTQTDWLESRHHSTSFEGGLPELHYDELASAFRIQSCYADGPKDLLAMMEPAMKSEIPLLLEVNCGFAQKTIPMLKSGRPIEDSSPLLPRDVLQANMLVPLAKESETP